jgi:hypothetical protein
MRLLTRFDFDGICCAALLHEVGVVDDVKFCHPKDLQDGIIPVTKDDVLANVPLVEGCGLWFDHHSSEMERHDLHGHYEGASKPALSAARVIYEYYDGENKLSRFEEMMKFVDIADAALFTPEDILNPKGWVLLAFICDPRTGLSFFQDFRINHYDFMQEMIDILRTTSIDRIMENRDVKERADQYFKMEEHFEEFLLKHSKSDGPVAITDMRDLQENPPGNRFLIYSLFPDTNISLRLMDGKGKQNIVFSMGHSITNRTSKINVGSLLLKYGGGGHERAGTCQVPHDDADHVLGELIEAIKSES